MERRKKFTVDVDELERLGYAVVSKEYLAYLEYLQAISVAVAVGETSVSELTEAIGKGRKR